MLPAFWPYLLSYLMFLGALRLNCQLSGIVSLLGTCLLSVDAGVGENGVYLAALTLSVLSGAGYSLLLNKETEGPLSWKSFILFLLFSSFFLHLDGAVFGVIASLLFVLFTISEAKSWLRWLQGLEILTLLVIGALFERGESINVLLGFVLSKELLKVVLVLKFKSIFKKHLRNYSKLRLLRG